VDQKRLRTTALHIGPAIGRNTSECS